MPMPEPLIITVLALFGLGAVAWMLCALEPVAEWMGSGDDGMALRLEAADMHAASEELVSR